MSAENAKPQGALEHKTVSQIRKDVKSVVSNPRVKIAGECVAPRRTGSRWNFDLVSVSPDGLDVMPCTIWEDQAIAITTGLAKARLSLETAMTDGMLLKLSGSTWLANDGRVCLRVTDLAPDFSRRGQMFLEDQRSLAALNAAGASTGRLLAPYVHSAPGTALAELKRAPRKIMVLAPENSQGLGDFKRRVGSKKEFSPDITYRSFSWPTAGIESLRSHLNDAAHSAMDMVVILRGGGHWSDLRGFQREDLALAIHESKVPVATAVGHDADISLADRAAAVSFATPTAAAEAIMADLKRRYWIKKNAASRNAERHRQRSLPQEPPTPQDSAEYKALESKLLEARSDWAKALQSAIASGQAQLHNAAQQHSAELQYAFYLHTKDLVENAERRVRRISQLLTIGTLGAVAFLMFAARTVLGFFLSTVEPAVLGFSYFAVAAAGGSVVWLQRRARKNLVTPAAKQLKRPPANVDEWRFAIKGVKTISRLRKLLLHRPC